MDNCFFESSSNKIHVDPSSSDEDSDLNDESNKHDVQVELNTKKLQQHRYSTWKRIEKNNQSYDAMDNFFFERSSNESYVDPSSSDEDSNFNDEQFHPQNNKNTVLFDISTRKKIANNAVKGIL